MRELIRSLVPRVTLLASLLITSAFAQTSPLSDLDSLRYIASHGDLTEAFGADPAKGRNHYEQWGIKEGRKITFEPLAYIASYGDLIDALGVNSEAGARHYIQFGYREGRKTTFVPLVYIATYPDLINAFSDNANEGSKHFIRYGYREGRKSTFDALSYVASYGDLIGAIGVDRSEAARHYIKYGYAEGRRITFNPLRYTASYGDLIESFGLDEKASSEHFIRYGFFEGRRSTFNSLLYLASYPDLIQEYGSRANWEELKNPVTPVLLEVMTHYITKGYAEGRSVSFDPKYYFDNNESIGIEFKNDSVLQTIHWIKTGLRGGRVGYPDSRLWVVPGGGQNASHFKLAWGTNAQLGSSVGELIGMRNAGGKPGRLLSIASDNSQFAIDPQTNNCFALEYRSETRTNCSVRILFTPTVSGEVRGTLSIRTSVETIQLPVIARGVSSEPPWRLTASVSSLDFGQVRIGDKKRLAVRVANNSTRAINLISISRGSVAGDLQIDYGCQPTLRLGDSCEIGATFSPTATSQRNLVNSIVVASQSDNPRLEIPISGTVEPSTISTGSPLLASSVATLHFSPGATQAINSIGPMQSFSLSNMGGTSLSVSGVKISGVDAGNFTQSNNCAALAPSTKCVVTVSFRPTSPGPKDAAITISHNAGSDITVALTGNKGFCVAPTFSPRTVSDGLGSGFVTAVHSSASRLYVGTLNASGFGMSDAGGLSISADGGKTFSNKTIANGLGSNSVRSVFSAADSVYVATDSGLGISSNGGQSFVNRTSRDGLANDLVYSVVASGNTLYAGTATGISISRDKGLTFENKSTLNGLPSGAVRDVYVDGFSIYAATDEGLAISRDGGKQFALRTTANGLGSNFVRSVQGIGDRIFVGTTSGLAVSDDGGLTFKNMVRLGGFEAFPIHTLEFIDGVLFAGSGNGLHISFDEGESFITRTGGNGITGGRVSAMFRVDNTVFVGGNGSGVSVATLVSDCLPISLANSANRY